MEYLLLLFLSILVFLLPFVTVQGSSSSSSTVDVQVGIILDFDSPVGKIGKCCLSVARSDFYSTHNDYKSRLVLEFRDSNGSVVSATTAALDLMQEVEVVAIIGPQKSAQANFVMNLGDKAHIPFISFSATSPSLIPQTPYFIRTAQSDANQVQAIAFIVNTFQWRQVVIIYEDSEFGNGIMPYLLNALQEVNARVSHRSAFPRSADNASIGEELSKIKTMQTRVFVVHMSQSVGTRLFLKAKELGMMSEGYVWIVTSGLMDLLSFEDLDVVEALQGVLSVKPLVPKSREFQSFAAKWSQMFLEANPSLKPAETSMFGLWAYDTFCALAMAVERVINSSVNLIKNEANVRYSTDPFALRISTMGPELLEALLATKFQGIAGDFSLVNGQLEQTVYQIVNVIGRDKRDVGIWAPSSHLSLKINSSSIIWPGNSTIAPRGWEFPVSGKKLRIGVPQKPGFNEFLKVETDPQTNAVSVSGPYKDVFDSVIATLLYNVSYEYTAYPFFDPNGSRVGTYDDLVHRVSLQDHYDAALGDITITANRSIYADFTLPFAEGGITCIVPIEYEDANDVFTFLHPLTKQLWLTTLIFYSGTALAVWILGSRVIANSNNSPNQHAGMICYFPFFPGEGIEGSLLCLVLLTWAFVASLLNSTYTASLSSRLTVQKLHPTVRDMAQLIKNGDYVGCQEGSFLVSFLKSKGFEESKIRTYSTGEACNEALTKGSQNGGISAYYDVLPHIMALLSQHCGEYMILDPIYRTDGFAFAFPKGSPIVADISRAIIQLIENSTILKFEEYSSSNTTCSGLDGTSSPTSVTLRSFLVLFIITGCVTCACLLVSLLVYLSKNAAFLKILSGFRTGFLSRIHALPKYFKKSTPSSHLKASNTRNQIPKS